MKNNIHNNEFPHSSEQEKNPQYILQEILLWEKDFHALAIKLSQHVERCVEIVKKLECTKGDR